MESLWVYEGPFSKTVIFPIDLNHFIKLRSEFRVDFVLLWGHFWHMKVTLGPLGVTSEQLWAYRRRMAGMRQV